MSRLILLLLAAFSLTLCTSVPVASASGTDGAGASKPYYSVSASSGPVGFTVSKIEFRRDLTRIYGRLIGTPHTSGRIDALTLSLPGKEAVASTDIDGIDMKRWFQWEDENYIDVEIDFPPMKSPQKMTINLTGPKGNSSWTIVRK